MGESTMVPEVPGHTIRRCRAELKTTVLKGKEHKFPLR